MISTMPTLTEVDMFELDLNLLFTALADGENNDDGVERDICWGRDVFVFGLSKQVQLRRG